MSLTKRYLESLPEEQQNEILGSVDQDEAEWYDDLSPVSHTCTRCGTTAIASDVALCEYCESRAYRRSRCDRSYGSQ